MNTKAILCFIANGILFSATIVRGQLLNRTVVKFNVSGAVFQSYTAQYERVLTPHSTVTFSASYTPNAPLPFKQALLDQYGDNNDARRAIETTLFTKRIGTIEYRFYPAGHAPRGWYIAPFARYASMDISNDYTYTTQNGVLHHAHLNAGFKAGGAGVLLGYQFLFGKHVGLDLWLLGPFYGTNINAVFTGEDPRWSELTEADKIKLKHDIDTTQLPLYTVESTLNLPTITARLTGPYYGVRAFGLAIAYSF